MEDQISELSRQISALSAALNQHKAEQEARSATIVALLKNLQFEIMVAVFLVLGMLYATS